jgi:hypothetical protein
MPLDLSLLTSAEKDLLEERAGVLEYEAGYSRGEAEKAALRQILDARFSSSASIEGHQSAQEARRASLCPSEATLHGEAPNKAVFSGIEALRYFTAHSVPVKPFYTPGADADARTYSAETPLEAGKRYKVYIRGRFLVLDIDRNHKDGGDGVKNLYKHLESIGKPRPLLPAFMQDLENGVFPFYMETPHGGLHLYFRYTGPYVVGSLAPDVELKNLQVSAGYKLFPGSGGQLKPYILHGNIEDAPLLPAFILEKIFPPAAAQPVYKPSWQEKKDFSHSRPSWALIVEWTDKDSFKAGAGRNNRAYSLALHAANHGWDKQDALEALQHEPSIGDLPQREITSAVNSAYRRTFSTK